MRHELLDYPSSDYYKSKDYLTPYTHFARESIRIPAQILYSTKPLANIAVAVAGGVVAMNAFIEHHNRQKEAAAAKLTAIEDKKRRARVQETMYDMINERNIKDVEMQRNNLMELKTLNKNIEELKEDYANARIDEHGYRNESLKLLGEIEKRSNTPAAINQLEKKLLENIKLVEDNIKELREQRDTGVISKDEYRDKKLELLNANKEYKAQKLLNKRLKTALTAEQLAFRYNSPTMTSATSPTSTTTTSTATTSQTSPVDVGEPGVQVEEVQILPNRLYPFQSVITSPKVTKGYTWSMALSEKWNKNYGKMPWTLENTSNSLAKALIESSMYHDNLDDAAKAVSKGFTESDGFKHMELNRILTLLKNPNAWKDAASYQNRKYIPLPLLNLVASKNEWSSTFNNMKKKR